VLDGTGMPQTAVAIGGASDMAREVLRALAGRRLSSVVLAGRSDVALDVVARELRALGVKSVRCRPLDVTFPASLRPFVREVVADLGEVDLVLVAAGQLGTAALDKLDVETVSSLVATNLSGPAALTTEFAKHMVSQGYGRIVVFSSVAGVRTRKSNFVYGASKAGLDGFALGLSAALAGTGVRVTVVRPGFVKTKMTAGMKPAIFPVDAKTVAKAVVRSLETGQEVVWVPAQLRYLFALLRVLPAALWRRLPE
jgi:decaprenylphospho-beta-D-erythro-pentofuranosid-2-ulose 2-reductase